MVVAIAPWSIVLTPGKAEVIVPQGDLQVKNAALPDELQDNAARTSVKLTYQSLASLNDDEDEEDKDEDDDDEDDDEAPQGAVVSTVLCSLTPGKIEQSTCEIILEQDMEYILEAVGKNKIHVYGNYIDQAPVDQPPFGSDTDEDEDEDAEGAYGLDEVSSDVEVPVDVDEAALDEAVGRFVEIQDEEEPPKNLKRPREDAMDVDEHEENLSKSQKKKLAKKLKATDGVAVPAPAPEQKVEEKKVEKQGKEKKDKAEKKGKSEQKDGDKKAKGDKGDGEKEAKGDKGDGEKQAKGDGGKQAKGDKGDGEKKEKGGKGDGEKKGKGDKKGERTLEGGVKVRDAKVGSGSMAKKGDKLEIRYIGKFLDGTVFDKNTKGKPFVFALGQGDVVKGLDIGVAGMQVGGEREIVVPSSMGYGNKRVSDIPPNTILKFEVKLLEIK